MDSADWDRRYAGTALLWSAEPNQFVVEQVTRMRPGRVLDLACGEGRNCVWLATHGWRATGVDFSAVALGKARELAHRFEATPEWIEADLTRWTPEYAAYDLVLAAYLHLDAIDRRSVLRAASAALVPGGTLLVLGHDRSNLATGTSGPRDPEVLLDADELLDDLAGGPPLRVVRAGRITRRVTTNGRPQHAIDTCVVGVRPMQSAGAGERAADLAAASIPAVLPPAGYLVVHRYPTASELRRLRTAAGLPDPGPQATQDALDNSLAGLCLEAEAEPGRAVACGRIVGDGRTFLVMVDIAVDPAIDPSDETAEFLSALRAPGSDEPAADARPFANATRPVNGDRSANGTRPVNRSRPNGAGARSTGAAGRSGRSSRSGRRGVGIVAVVLAELSAWAGEHADPTAFVGVATRTGVTPVGEWMNVRA